MFFLLNFNLRNAILFLGGDKLKTSCTAERLKYLMENRNLRQVDILDLCKPYCQQYAVKMNKSDISQYLAGKSEPNQDKLAILSMALSVNESWLMGYDVSMQRDPPPYEEWEEKYNPDGKLEKEVNLIELMEQQHGKSTTEAFTMYTQLDSDDQGEIRGEMKQMLKSEKYMAKKVAKNA